MNIPEHYEPPENDRTFVYRRAWFHGYYGMKEESKPYTDDNLTIAYQMGYIDGNRYKSQETREQQYENQ